MPRFVFRRPAEKTPQKVRGAYLSRLITKINDERDTWSRRLLFLLGLCLADLSSISLTFAFRDLISVPSFSNLFRSFEVLLHCLALPCLPNHFSSGGKILRLCAFFLLMNCHVARILLIRKISTPIGRSLPSPANFAPNASSACLGAPSGAFDPCHRAPFFCKKEGDKSWECPLK